MRILQLSTYPIESPKHGGQKRAAEIRKKLEALGCVVLSLSISEPGHSVYHAQHDLVVSLHHYQKKYKTPCCGDLLTAEASVIEPKWFNFLKTHINTFNPDIILFEQPWLWLVIKKMLREKTLERKKTYLVYSSHNVEYTTKRLILEKLGVTPLLIAQVQAAIKALEEDLIAEADEILYVTEEDAQAFHDLNQGKKTLIIPNGVTKNTKNLVACNNAADSSLSSIDKNLSAWLKNNPYLLFIGSAYPPNALGFWEMMGRSLAKFSPEHHIITAGSIGNILFPFFPAQGRLYTKVNEEIIINMGEVGENLLQTLIEYSTGILLPITIGGGSNLKTAEAIVANKPIVSTTNATRGYKIIDRLTNFYIFDDAPSFSTIARDIVSGKIKWIPISAEEKKLRETVYWENALAPLEQLIERANHYGKVKA